MARKVDAEADPASKAILDQLQTKTVGAPPSSTGLTGDQLPETIFDVDDFDTVKNQVTLQLSNLELLNVLNTIGQVTNKQSKSGPIPDTQFVSETNSITNSHKTVFQPDRGQVWQLVAASIITLDGASNMILNIEDSTSSTRVQIDTFNGTSNPMELNEPIFISNTAFLTCRTDSASSGNARLSVSLVRVR